MTWIFFYFFSSALSFFPKRYTTFLVAVLRYPRVGSENNRCDKYWVLKPTFLAPSCRRGLMTLKLMFDIWNRRLISSRSGRKNLLLPLGWWQIEWVICVIELGPWSIAGHKTDEYTSMETVKLTVQYSSKESVSRSKLVANFFVIVFVL